MVSFGVMKRDKFRVVSCIFVYNNIGAFATLEEGGGGTSAQGRGPPPPPPPRGLLGNFCLPSSRQLVLTRAQCASRCFVRQAKGNPREILDARSATHTHTHTQVALIFLSRKQMSRKDCLRSSPALSTNVH